MNSLFIYCAGGLGRETYDIASRQFKSNEILKRILFVDDAFKNKKPKKFYESEIVSSEYMIKNFRNKDCIVIASGEPSIRSKIYSSIKKKKLRFSSPLVDPSSNISDTSNIKAGAVIAPLCSVQSDSKIKQNVFVNTMSIIGHDVEIGSDVVISSMVNLGGASIIGKSSYVGMGALIKENVRIGKDCIIGMGSVVHNDIPDGMIALGNPARPVKRNTRKRVFK